MSRVTLELKDEFVTLKKDNAQINLATADLPIVCDILKFLEITDFKWHEMQKAEEMLRAVERGTYS